MLKWALEMDISSMVSVFKVKSTERGLELPHPCGYWILSLHPPRLGCVATVVGLYRKSCLVNELDKNGVAVALYWQSIGTDNTLPNFFPVILLHSDASESKAVTGSLRPGST